MNLKYIGKSKNKKVFATNPHALDSFKMRNLSYKEVLEALQKRYTTYPISGGRQKIRSELTNGKKVFLTIKETGAKIIVITGGES